MSKVTHFPDYVSSHNNPKNKKHNKTSVLQNTESSLQKPKPKYNVFPPRSTDHSHTAQIKIHINNEENKTPNTY